MLLMQAGDSLTCQWLPMMQKDSGCKMIRAAASLVAFCNQSLIPKETSHNPLMIATRTTTVWLKQSTFQCCCSSVFMCSLQLKHHHFERQVNRKYTARATFLYALALRYEACMQKESKPWQLGEFDAYSQLTCSFIIKPCIWLFMLATYQPLQ